MLGVAFVAVKVLDVVTDSLKLCMKFNISSLPRWYFKGKNRIARPLPPRPFAATALDAILAIDGA